MAERVSTRRLRDAVTATPNRGQSHVFCGDPWSDMCDKTVAEPGGAFSPGLWTCGISVWIEADGWCGSADTVPADSITAGFGDRGRPPAIRSTWPGGDRTVTTELVTLAGEGAEGCDFLRIAVSAGATPARVHLVVRGDGPAGSRLRGANWEPAARRLVLDGGIRVGTEQGCHVSIHPDPGDSVDQTGEADADADADDVVVVLSFALVAAGAGWSGGVRVEHAFTDRPGGDLLPLLRPYASLSVDEGVTEAERRWALAVPVQVFAPDGAVADSWNGNAFHLLAGCEQGIPRISAVDYPVLWVRDAVIQIRALDTLGRHDLARAACQHLAPHVFAGGFGAEADAPGQGVWALVTHAELTQDAAWLSTMFPSIQVRVNWLDRMRHATRPLRAASVNRMPRYFASPAINLVCLPADDGLIRGRMDWQFPDFYVNAWAVAGYRCAARAARLLGHTELAGEWSAAATELETHLRERLLPRFGNDRDAVVAPYPTGVLADDLPQLKERFEAWYRETRLDAAGGRVAEPLWTYFEAAQAHNALELGLVDEAWVNLDAMIHGSGSWNLHAFGEGEPGGNEATPFGGLERARGWLDPARATSGNMPHGWTSAEMVNAIRAVFVQDRDDHVLLAPGVPSSWWAQGARFGVVDMPTGWGPLSYTATASAGGGWDIHTTTTVPWRSAPPAAP